VTRRRVGRKARDRIEHFLRADIDNSITRQAYGRALGSFFSFWRTEAGKRVQDIGPLDERDYLEAAKANGLSTATQAAHGRHSHALRPPSHREGSPKLNNRGVLPRLPHVQQPGVVR